MAKMEMSRCPPRSGPGSGKRGQGWVTSPMRAFSASRRKVASATGQRSSGWPPAGWPPAAASVAVTACRNACRAAANSTLASTEHPQPIALVVNTSDGAPAGSTRATW